jgi:chromate transport protein ChrA
VAVGIAVNVIPFLLVKAVGRLRVAPSMHSTIKPVVAALAFGITWGIVIWRAIAAFGWAAGGVAFILLPVYLAAVVLFVERFTLMLRAYRRWRAPGDPQTFSEQIAERRTAVVEAVLGS